MYYLSIRVELPTLPAATNLGLFGGILNDPLSGRICDARCRMYDFLSERVVIRSVVPSVRGWEIDWGATLCLEGE